MITEDVKAWHSKLCDMTEDELVKLLEDEQIKAVPGDNRSCAISELIKQKTGEQVATGWGGVLGVSANGDTDFSGPMLSNSEVIRRFISGFDKHAYPQLER